MQSQQAMQILESLTVKNNFLLYSIDQLENE